MNNNSENIFISDTVTSLCGEYIKNNTINPEAYEKYHILRGLRNKDGSGVRAGLTKICNVHGYLINETERMPVDGELTYRGVNINDLVAGFQEDDRFGFEETAYLLLFGTLPTPSQLENFTKLLAECRELPPFFVDDMIIKAPSPDIMNKLARSVLALYSYDDNPDDTSLHNIIRQSVNLIAQFPTIAVSAYQVKRRHYNNDSMFFHPIDKNHSTAECILSSLRPDRQFTDAEAKLLDLCLVLHAEHGGGNNSTFSCRVLSSSGTDTYSAISAAVGSLKGPKHGGANIKVVEMLEYIKEGVENYNNDDEIAAFLEKLIRKEAGNKSGLIYGMGHAVYTKSDPRAKILKANAKALAFEKGFDEDFIILDAVERLTPEVFAKVKGVTKDICANVDLYSGLVYKVLGIPTDLYTPLFAISRVTGWSAHRIEELYSGGKIIRPAYTAIDGNHGYTPISSR